MLFKIAKAVEIVIILGKIAILQKILDFMQMQYTVATFVHINVPRKPFFLYFSVI